jgi:hypothetical protein
MKKLALRQQMLTRGLLAMRMLLLTPIFSTPGIHRSLLGIIFSTTSKECSHLVLIVSELHPL